MLELSSAEKMTQWTLAQRDFDRIADGMAALLVTMRDAEERAERMAASEGYFRAHSKLESGWQGFVGRAEWRGQATEEEIQQHIGHLIRISYDRMTSDFISMTAMRLFHSIRPDPATHPERYNEWRSAGEQSVEPVFAPGTDQPSDWLKARDGEMKCRTDDLTQHGPQRSAPLELSIPVVGDYQEVLRLHSRIVVRTESIDRLVLQGPAVVPSIVRVMQPDIEFDSFVRCYSICDQIIRRELPHTSIWWEGGCSTFRDANGDTRLAPEGQLDLAAFRVAVIRDIVIQYETLRESRNSAR